MACLVCLIFLWSNGARLQIFALDDHYVNVLRLAAVLLIFGGSIVAFKLRTWRFIIRSFYFRAILLLLAAVMLPTFITGVFRYGQSVTEVIRQPLMYYALFVFVLLAFITSPRDRVYPLLMALVWTVTGICALYIIASLIPQATSEWFVAKVAIGDRFGNARLTASAAINNLAIFSIIYLVLQLFTVQARWWQRVWFSIGIVILLYYQAFVLISRTRLLGLLACLVIFLFPHINWRKLFVPGIVFIGLLCTLQMTTQIKPLDIFVSTYQSIITMDRDAERDTISIRLDGVQYYYEEFLNSRMIGIGLVSPVRSEQSDIAYAMTKLAYNPADLGILAVLFFFGIPGILATIVVAARIFRDSRYVIRHGTLENRAIALAIRLYLTFYIISFYHVFLYDEYALEWGVLFFALTHVYALSKPVNVPPRQQPLPVLPFRRGHFVGESKCTTKHSTE